MLIYSLKTLHKLDKKITKFSREFKKYNLRIDSKYPTPQYEVLVSGIKTLFFDNFLALSKIYLKVNIKRLKLPNWLSHIIKISNLDDA